MLNVCDLQGLPAISSAGEEVGRVRGVIADAAGARAAFFVLESAAWYESPRVIRGEDVCAVGPDALIYRDSGQLPALWDHREALQLLRTGALNEGTQVYTRSGRRLAQLESCRLDEQGRLTGCRLEDGTQVEMARICALTAALMLVEEGEAGSGRGTEADPPEPPPREETARQRVTPQAAAFLRGKRAGRDVSVNGQLLVRAGDVLDEETVARAAQAGCLAEVTMHAQ